MPTGSPVKVMQDSFAYSALDHARLFPDWQYAGEFEKACEKDGGTASRKISADAVHVYCERDALPWWEYVEGFADIRPLYTGMPLKADHTVFYRAIALVPKK